MIKSSGDKDSNMKEDNIYVYNIEDDERDETRGYYDEADDSPANYAQPEQEEVEESTETADETGKKRGALFLLLLRTLLQPIEGWKELRRMSIKPEDLLSGLLYPLLAIVAACKFANMLYFPQTSLSEVVVEAVISFVSYFFGYFLILMVIKLVLPPVTSRVFEEPFGKNFIILSLSTLCLFSILLDILPMFWPILIFLPLWTIYIIFRGIRFFKLPETGLLRFNVIVCLAVVGVPVAIDYLLNLIMPV